MYSIEKLEKREKDLKKELRELGGLGEVFPDNKKNCEDLIAAIKAFIKANKTYEENKSSRFGKGAKLKKEALAQTEDLEKQITELENEKTELDNNIAPIPAITQERTAELGAMVDDFKTAEIKALPFEELATAFGAGIAKISKISSAEQKNEILLEKYNRQQKELHVAFFEKLHNSEEFFIAYSPATHLPYLDLREQNNQACLWLFTKEDYAKNCRNYFARQYIFIDIVKFTNKDFFEYSKNLPRLGFNAIVINNGVHNLTVETGPVIGPIKYSCPINPTLHARRFDFFQALMLFNKVPQTNHTLYEKFHNPLIMKAKETVMLNEFAKAQYTIVMKSVKKTDENGKETESFEIPTVVKGETRFLLTFTDMLEFDAWKKATGFKTDEPGFAAKVMDFNGIDNIAKDTGSELLLDIQSWCFEMTKERREMIKNIAVHVKNVEERTNEELQKNSSDN